MMEYAKVYDDIDGEPRYWIRFTPETREPVFYIGTDIDRVYCFYAQGQVVRGSMQMAIDFGYDPEAIK